MDVVVSENCQYVSHGCTGKGNDQVRFELAFYALQPDVKVIAPWRDAVFYDRFAGRQALLDFASEKGIPVFQTAAKPWSTGTFLPFTAFQRRSESLERAIADRLTFFREFL